MSGPGQQPYTQQPMGTPGMAANKLNVKGLPYTNGEREWSSGLCSCGDQCGTFLLSCFCPCIVYGQNKSRIDHLTHRGSPHPSGGDICGGGSWLYGGLLWFGVSCFLEGCFRSDVRKRYNISGNGCMDCCCATWCIPCEQTQISQEIALEESTYQKY
ncbi:PLAC8-domain-containing protein [Mycena floridula]|nr:PLAC8-domain-containing protein [Mycena floridula]